MKNPIVLLFLLVAMSGQAQTAVNKSFPVRAGQTIMMQFDYPEMIRVSTWDKNEVLVTGTISINQGENDDAFKLTHQSTDKLVSLRGDIPDLKSLPHRVTVVRGKEKMSFKTMADFRNYEKEHGEGYSMMNNGVDMDILLEIKVPRNVDTRVEATYGMVEIRSFEGPLTVEATYGGVDAALIESSTGALTAETNYGQIYSNLNIKLGDPQVEERDFHTVVSSRPGNGPHYRFESKYGNVYLRRAAAR